MSNGLLSIRKAAEYLDVTEDCLRKWEKGGKITPFKTAGGHRRYKREDLDRLVGIESDDEVKKACCATYARVSSKNSRFQIHKSEFRKPSKTNGFIFLKVNIHYLRFIIINHYSQFL